MEQENLSVMAFADDIVAIARTKEVANEQLQLISGYLADLGMSLSPSKCATFEYVPKGKTWYVRNPGILLNGEQLSYAIPEIFKYLGEQQR